ncbi:hypothetical protein PTKIN_Ptkin16aG0033700 [Pterospermum kingtungense]
MSSLREVLSKVGEVVVSKFFDILLEKLGSSELLQFASEKQIQEELHKLKKELEQIRALLDDAEKRQITDQSVKIWLSDLENLAYDVDDIVDEIETEISRRNLMLERRGSSSKKPRLIPHSFNDVFFNSKMMTKIKYITAKLKDLEPQRHQLHLMRMNDSQKSIKMEERPQPTSLNTETHVYGRDEDIKKIQELVLKSDDEGNFVIPIVGMGGIGKTTLVQLVYNDATVVKHFDFRAWVTVSNDFDVKRITQDILEYGTPRPCDDNNLSSLQEKVKTKLSGKRFLIVLDDVWSEDYNKWTIFQAPFLTRTPGSKIIVTTRHFAVSSTMGASHPYELKVLSENSCLSIFAQHALGATDFGGHPNLKEVGEKIVRKCSGVPLAAKTLGGLLRANVDYDAWKDILESEIWELPQHQCGIIPALHLSYHHLPPHLKRCFAYCSILPKDYEFEEKEIILLWRAEGFLQGARDKHSIEDLGHKYFRDLVSRSLFQRSGEGRSRFVMHDLINDLAQSVARDICFRIEGDKKISKNARHLSYIRCRCDGMKKFDDISEAQHLRTFLPLSQRNNSWYYATSKNSWGYYVANDVVMDLMPKLSFLRVLSLGGYHIIELPDSIGALKHLRYLDFSHTLIKCLPESVSALYHLETLLLRECPKLEKLPSEMANLINLCYLDITGTDGLKGMPSNFCTLSDLQTLSKFVLTENKGFQIRELEGFSYLKGQLCISGLENVVKTEDACKAKLKDKAGLDKIELKWCEDFGNRIGEMEKKVLDLLQPSKKIKELSIKNYCGTTLANWVGDSSFSELQSLCLENCPNCISLPSIGPFPRLRELHIVSCPELLGSVPESLPSLEKLEIRECKKLVVLIQGCPMLSELEIGGCNKVVYKGFADGSSLKRVSFSKIPEFSCAAECLTIKSIKVECLVIEDCMELLRDNNWVLLTQSMSIGELRIVNLSQLVSVGAEEGEESMQLKMPCTIYKLTIEKCERLEKLSAALHYLTSLTALELVDCPKLISLSNNNLPLNLELLHIYDCPSLLSLSSRGEFPMRLKQLRIWSCAKLESIGEEIQDDSSLESIIISGTKINNLPQGLNKLCQLRYISIWQCSNLACFPESGLPTSNLKILYLGYCEKLQALPHGIHGLNCLQRLSIMNCSSVTSFPEEGIPANLRNLMIGGPNICKPLIKWGLHRLTSLKSLYISNGCPDAVLFPLDEIGMMLPSSLTDLCIMDFPKLEILSCKGFKDLTSLKKLNILNCPNLKSLPEKHMLSSLFVLNIKKSPVLKERCEKEKGAEWSNIAHIPCVLIDDPSNILFGYDSD